MSAPNHLATALADVVASREHADQPALLDTVAAATRRVNDLVPAVQPWQITVGDELQAAYATLAQAVTGQLRLRLLLLDAEPQPVELRVGLGVGEVVRSEAAEPPLGQSGEGWWNARAALEEARARASATHWPTSVRSAIRGTDVGPVGALLVGLDDLLGRMDAADRRILRGLLDGERQVDVADALEVSQPAVARRSRDRGPAAVYRMLSLLEEPG